jgi:hypothetical protein
MRFPVSRFFQSLRACPGSPGTREFLLWCLPALLVGVIVRTVLMVQLPYGVYHFDSPDFLTTPDSLIFEHRWELHMKKTFLVPALFCIPFVLHLRALVFLPILQHVMGLGVIVMVGLLCRLWFARWKLFIVPLTLIAAVNPYLLWYEHTLMAETTFVFCTLLLAVAGTLYALGQSWRRFVFLAVALILEAGARPEGKLLFGFGLFLIVLMHWRAWREMGLRFALLAVLGVTMHFLTKTQQAGLLLYTSVARLTPENLKCAPGFDPYIEPLRRDLKARWAQYPAFPKVRDRRLVAQAAEEYMKENAELGHGRHHLSINEFCFKVAAETCRRNLFYLPILVYHKFRYTAWDTPSGMLDNYWIFDRQSAAFGDALERSSRLSAMLTGQTLKTAGEWGSFVAAHEGESPWFNDWSNAWGRLVRGATGQQSLLRFPDGHYEEAHKPMIYFGIPLYFVVAAAGLLLVMLRRGPLQPLQIAWGVTMLGLFFTIILTANTKPRFRFVFEPFWFLYIGLLFDTLLFWLQSLGSRKPATSAPEAP